MSTDVMKKIIEANDVKFGNAVVKWGNQNGTSKTTVVGSIDNDNVSASGTDVIWEGRLQNRFDDPTYYSA